jgi:hypothetical protein
MREHENYIGFEVLTVIVMNVAIFWDIVPCSLHVNRHLQGRKSAEQETNVWQVARQ